MFIKNQSSMPLLVGNTRETSDPIVARVDVRYISDPTTRFKTYTSYRWQGLQNGMNVVSRMVTGRTVAC